MYRLDYWYIDESLPTMYLYIDWITGIYESLPTMCLCIDWITGI